MMIVASICVIFMFSYIGFLLNRKYIEKVKFYFELSTLSNYLKTNISFKKTNINDAFSAYLSNNKNVYIKYFLQNCHNYSENTCKKLDILSNNEIHELVDILNSIGECSIDFEKEKLSYFEQLVKQRYNESKEKLKSEGSLKLKTSICLGLMIALVIV